MLIKLLRFIRGYITFSVKGKFPERLINLIGKNGLTYWDILPQKDGFRISMPVSDYKKLRSIIRGKHIRTRVQTRRGLPFVKKRYKNRIGLPIGTALAVVLVIILSNFVWIITVNGNTSIPSFRILKVLRDNGFTEGTFSGSVDAKLLRIKVMEDMPQIRWMSVNITGCTAQVEVKESYKKPKVSDKKTVCNIKASRDALITDIRVFSGTALTKAGSAVVKGQLLISGVMTAKDGTNRLVHANGEIYGRTRYQKIFKIPKAKNSITPAGGRIDRRRCELFGLSFPLDFQPITYDSFKSVTKEYSLDVNNVNLPMKITEQTITEMNVRRQHVKNHRQSLRQQQALYEQFAFDKKQIESKTNRYSQTDTHYILTTDYTIKEELSEIAEIIVQ